MEFYSRSKYNNDHKTSPVGEEEKTTYELYLDENGQEELKETGKTNVYEMIQAAAKDVDIYTILERYENGDLAAINKKNGFYEDISEIPNNINELNEAAKNARTVFDSLTEEQRENVLKVLSGNFDIKEKTEEQPKEKQEEQPKENGGIKYE